jgi:hypothetical protein
MIGGDKKLKDKADDYDKLGNYSYTLFIIKEAKSTLEYFERKIYEGKRIDYRDEQASLF